MSRVSVLINSLLIVPLLICFSEYYLLSPEQVKSVIDATLPIFSLTSIAFALKKTGDIGYGYFWVYSLSYAVFYVLWILAFIILSLQNKNGFKYNKPIPAKIHLGSFAFILGGFALCFVLKVPYLDNVFHPFRPRVSGALVFGLVISAIGAGSSLYVALAISRLKVKIQRGN
jgi:hypothetical protein